MGGGGGFNPIPIITTLIFGPEAGGLVGAAMTSLDPGRPGSDDGPGNGADNGAAEAAAEAQAAEESAAAERRRMDRKRQERVLLDQARTARRADLAGANAQAQTLGQPALETSQLKEKLGQ